MYQNDAEMLFPARVIPCLRDLRGESWHELVEEVCEQPEKSVDALAFSLLMIHLAGCLTCHSDSYRAMQGCTTCARQTVSRFKGTDSEMLQEYVEARAEVDSYMLRVAEPTNA